MNIRQMLVTHQYSESDYSGSVVWVIVVCYSRYFGADKLVHGFQWCSSRQRSKELHRLTGRQQLNSQHCVNNHPTTGVDSPQYFT